MSPGVVREAVRLLTRVRIYIREGIADTMKNGLNGEMNLCWALLWIDSILVWILNTASV